MKKPILLILILSRCRLKALTEQAEFAKNTGETTLEGGEGRSGEW